MGPLDDEVVLRDGETGKGMEGQRSREDNQGQPNNSMDSLTLTLTKQEETATETHNERMSNKDSGSSEGATQSINQYISLHQS